MKGQTNNSKLKNIEKDKSCHKNTSIYSSSSHAPPISPFRREKPSHKNPKLPNHTKKLLLSCRKSHYRTKFMNHLERFILQKYDTFPHDLILHCSDLILQSDHVHHIKKLRFHLSSIWRRRNEK